MDAAVDWVLDSGVSTSRLGDGVTASCDEEDFEPGPCATILSRSVEGRLARGTFNLVVTYVLDASSGLCVNTPFVKIMQAMVVATSFCSWSDWLSLFLRR